MEKGRLCLSMMMVAASASVAFAGEAVNMSAAPGAGANFNNVVMPDAIPDPKVATGTVQVVLNASCFGTNLRSVGNPLSPASTVEMTVKLAGVPEMKVKFPGNLVTRGGSGCSYDENGNETCAQIPVTEMDMNGQTVPAGTKGAFQGNSMKLIVPVVDKVATVSSSGEYNVEERQKVVEKISFYQYGVSGGAYMANTGTLSSSTRFSLSPSGNLLVVNAAFPGQNGFCGGYYSPLMLFFDKKMPTFRNQSSFPLNPEVESVYWMEKNHPGYLLALDEKGDGKILSGKQLFGKNEKFANGFEALKAHDSNKDGVIDEKDKVFAKLVLWQDRNGNGKSDKDEIVGLKKAGVVSIALKYSEAGSLEFGERAKANEYGSFTFRNSKSGKVETGDVYDIWFNMVKPKSEPAR